MNDKESEANIKRILDGEIAFLDLGAGDGASIDLTEKAFGRGLGVGVERSEKKIRQARARQSPVIWADATKLGLPERSVSFCTMMDFLEHLPGLDVAEAVLRSAAGVAKDFLFIRHPSFESVDYLASLGLKLGWTDWIGHSNPMRIEEIIGMFARLQLSDYCILPRGQILSSGHSAIVPLSAPTDTSRYDAAIHGPKTMLFFREPVWTQFDIFVRLNAHMSDEEWEAILQTFSLAAEIERTRQSYDRAKLKRDAAEAAFKKEKEKRLAAEQALREEQEKRPFKRS